MPISIETVIDGLNEDLAEEYKHIHFYLNAALRVAGPQRATMRDLLIKLTHEAVLHTQRIGDLVRLMGGTPTAKCNGFLANISDSVSVIDYAAKMENTVLKNMHERRKQCVELGNELGTTAEAVIMSHIAHVSETVASLQM